MKTPEEIAESIVAGGYDCPTPLDWQHQCRWMQDRIAAVIQAERDVRPPNGHVVTDDGVVRKVLGTLPITADGCVVMPGIEVFHPQQDFSFHLEVMALHGDERQDDDYPLPEDCEYMGHYSYYERDTGYSTYESYDVRACYSTREAAEAAKNKEKP